MMLAEEGIKIQKMIEDYIMTETSDPTKSPNSGGVRVFALKAFFEINDV